MGMSMGIGSIVWLIVIILSFVLLWLLYFIKYPINSLSYVMILAQNPQKISVHKLFYPFLFVFLLIFSIMVSLIPGIVCYCLLILFCVFWFIIVNVRFRLQST